MNLLMTFIQKAIGQGVAILFGATGEIVTEKSGNLNLGIPGIMYMGGISGLMGAFFYENGKENPNGFVAVSYTHLDVYKRQVLHVYSKHPSYLSEK